MLTSRGGWLVVLCIAASACGRGASRAATPAHEPSTPVAVPSAQASVSRRPATDFPTPPLPKDHDILVAVLHEGGTRVCEDPVRSVQGRWVARYWTAGFVPLIGHPRVIDGLAKYHGRPVVFRGRRIAKAPEPLELPAGATPCRGMLQARSDWIYTPDGILLRRHPRHLAGFKVLAAEALEGLVIRREKDGILVRFDNQLGRDFSAALTVTIHYEGCYGKPGAFAQDVEFPHGLLKTAGVERRVPVFAEAGQPGRRLHRADAVTITTAPGTVTLDLDVPLASFDAGVACDERLPKGRKTAP